MRLFLLFIICITANAQNYKGTVTTKNSMCRILGGWSKFSGSANLDVQITNNVNEMLTMYLISGSSCTYGESDPTNAIQYKENIAAKRERNFFEYFSNSQTDNFQSINATYPIVGKWNLLCMALCQTNPQNISDFDVRYTFVMRDYREISFQTTTHMLFGKYCYKIAEGKSSTGITAGIKIFTQKSINLVLETGLKCGLEYTSDLFDVKWDAFNNSYLKPYNRYINATFQETITIPHLIDSSYCYYVCMEDSISVTNMHYAASMDARPDLEKITLSNVEEAILVSYSKVSTNVTSQIAGDLVATSESKLESVIDQKNSDLESKLMIAYIISGIALGISIISSSFFIYLYIKGK